MQLHVHLRQRFLHQPNLIAGALHQPPAMRQQRARRADLLLGTKRRPQQPHRMQVLQPLALLPVRAAGRKAAVSPAKCIGGKRELRQTVIRAAKIRLDAEFAERRHLGG